MCVCVLSNSLSVFLSLTEGRRIDPVETPHKTKDKCSKHWQDPKKPKFHVEWALALVLSTHNSKRFATPADPLRPMDVCIPARTSIKRRGFESLAVPKTSVPKGGKLRATVCQYY